ncbi:MAG: hypothetical protein M1831_004513 [Alyxoria varia]|nr:MAG: hypothetical protein M1831_004513 [Alyxoria varia]
MAKANSTSQVHEKGKGKKLQRFPQGARISKRPLLRPQIASAYAGRDQEKVVYLSSKSPFMSAFKRVQKLLKQVDKRAMQSILAHGSKKGKTRSKIAPDNKADEEVFVRATGKAIDKALNLALFIKNKSEYAIRMKTSTADAIDDIEDNTESANLPEIQIRQSPMIEIAVRLRS